MDLIQSHTEDSSSSITPKSDDNSVLMQPATEDPVGETNTDSERKLASIQIIERIDPHTGANALELATILGWQIITRIGETTVGTKVIYCEIDSLLPIEAPWLPPAVKDRIVKEKTKDFFRVKTIKLRGELSQGLIIPIVDSLPEIDGLDIGDDVTKILGIKKYEPPTLSGGFSLFQSKSGGNFPSQLVDKTDEPRVQSHPKLFTLLQGKPYYMTIKLDGTSVTYLLDPNTQELLVCSRNIKRKKPDDPSLCPYWSMAIKYDLENKLKLVPHLAIQGEICGPNIQKNLLGLKSIDLFIFNVVDIRDKRRLSLNEMIPICTETLKVNMVPLEEQGDEFTYDNIKTLLAKAQGVYSGTKNAREGLVIRAKDQSLSFKAINNDYLLKHGY